MSLIFINKVARNRQVSALSETAEVRSIERNSDTTTAESQRQGGHADAHGGSQVATRGASEILRLT